MHFFRLQKGNPHRHRESMPHNSTQKGSTQSAGSVNPETSCCEPPVLKQNTHFSAVTPLEAFEQLGVHTSNSSHLMKNFNKLKSTFGRFLNVTGASFNHNKMKYSLPICFYQSRCFHQQNKPTGLSAVLTAYMPFTS